MPRHPQSVTERKINIPTAITMHLQDSSNSVHKGSVNCKPISIAIDFCIARVLVHVARVPQGAVSGSYT